MLDAWAIASPRSGTVNKEDVTSRAVSPSVVSLFVLFTLASVVINRTAGAVETIEAKKIFNQRCSACHSFGRGVKVGPDLKGVTQRRGRPWLLRFIRSSQSVIRGGDTIAQTLFAKFKQQRMPDWSDLSERQITGILDWFAGNGPEQKEPDERAAELATAADVDRARRLFEGSEPLTYGGTACGACHVVEERGVRTGGTLGPELTDTYRRFGDRALTLFLKRPCAGRAPESESAHYLAPEESFAIKGYLRRVAIDESEGENP